MVPAGLPKTPSISPKNRSYWSYCFLPLLLLACQRPLIEGRVETVKGEALPGVAVTVDGADYAALTDALGQYRVPYAPGQVIVLFNKSGYAPGQLALDLPQATTLRAATVRLWPLPPTAGVYLLENFDYRPMTRDIPERVFLPDGETAFAVKRAPELTTQSTAPEILAYRLPRYDARLTRLRQADAKLSAGAVETVPVWVPSGALGADLAPLDQPKGMLLRLRLDQPLEPGAYAVHWGALAGFSTLEERVFTFTIEAPPPPEPGPLEPSGPPQ